jgi:hypothetical protein
LAAVFAAGALASLPTFQAERRGWVSRFTWILVRYGLPFAAMTVITSWFVLRR